MCFSHLDSLNGSVDINLFSWMAIARHSDGIRSLSSWESMKMMCVNVFVCAHNYACAYLCMSATLVRIPCSIGQIRGTAGPGPLLSLLPSSTEPCLLCISHRSGGRGVQITVGLHIRLQLPVLSPPTSPHPTQDVLSVTVSTSPSGHIPDIWTAAGSPRVRQLEEKGGKENEGVKEMKKWSQREKNSQAEGEEGKNGKNRKCKLILSCVAS